MTLAGSHVRYAATRAWGWKHGFRELQLTASAAAAEASRQAAAAAAANQSVAQVAAAASAPGAAPAAPDQSVAQVIELAALDQSVAQVVDAVGAGATGSSEAAPPPAALESEVSPELVRACQDIAARVKDYNALQAAELETLVALGLRPAKRESDWLTCLHCRNNRRQEKLFQGTDQVREHFQHNHELPERAEVAVPDPDAAAEAMENMDEAQLDRNEKNLGATCFIVGVWAPVDVATRLAAEQATLPTPDSPPNFLEEVRKPSGAAADFFDRLLRTIQPSVAGNRRQLVRALLAVHPLPPFLQSVAQQRTSWGSSWEDLTAPTNVRWAVHDDGPDEPVHPLVTVRGQLWDDIPKASVYSTLLVQLVLAGCEAQLQDVSPAERQSGLEAVCIHINEASRAEKQDARLLLSATGQRPWKFDLNPGDIRRQYGGRTHKPTRVQAASGEAAGRSRRVLQRPG
eukprot:s556_g24.t1